MNQDENNHRRQKTTGNVALNKVAPRSESRIPSVFPDDIPDSMRAVHPRYRQVDFDKLRIEVRRKVIGKYDVDEFK